jgi:hypothetical protein
VNWSSLKKPAFLVALGALTLSSIGMGAAISRFKLMLRKEAIYPSNGTLLNSIPRESATWMAVGPDRYEHGEVLETLGTNNYLTRTYAKKKPAKPGAEAEPDLTTTLEFHTAYYTGMIDTVPHVPDRCFVAGGMQLAELTKDLVLPLDPLKMRPDKNAEGPLAGHLYTAHSSLRIPVHLPLDPDQLKLHTMSFLNSGRKLYAGYFFIANGGAVPRAEDVRLLAFDLHSKYAYYVKVQFTSSSATSEEDLAKLAASFLDENFGDLMECVPDWAEVEAGHYPPGNEKNK